MEKVGDRALEAPSDYSLRHVVAAARDPRPDPAQSQLGAGNPKIEQVRAVAPPLEIADQGQVR